MLLRLNSFISKKRFSISVLYSFWLIFVELTAICSGKVCNYLHWKVTVYFLVLSFRIERVREHVMLCSIFSIYSRVSPLTGLRDPLGQYTHSAITPDLVFCQVEHRKLLSTHCPIMGE